MEIPNHLIENAFKRLTTKLAHGELERALQALNRNHVNDILFKANSHAVIRTIDSNIHHIVANCKSRLRSDVVEAPDELIELLSTAKAYFDKSVRESDLKSLLIFLSVNCYLKIGIHNLLINANIKQEEIEKLSEPVAKLLSSVNYQINKPTDTPYYEATLFKTAEEGFKVEDVEKIYELILAMERGGRGFHFNFLLENLIYFFFLFNRKAFFAHISHLKHPHQNVFYFQSFQQTDIITLLNEPSVQNKWTLFELIRQLLKNERVQEVTENSQLAILDGLNKLYSNDSNIYKQSIAFFHSSKGFNFALGRQLSKLSETEISDICSNFLPINKYPSYLEQRDALLEQFKSTSERSKYLVALKVIFQRWCELRLSFEQSDTGYQNELLLTDFANFIVHWYQEELSSDQLISLFSQSLSKLIWIDCEWFKSYSKEVTNFHLYLTDAYLLSFALRNREIQNDKIIELTNDLKGNRILVSRFLNLESEGILTTIYENINFVPAR